MYEEFEQWMINTQKLAPRSALGYRRRIRQAIEDLYFDPCEHNAREVEKWVLDRGGSPSNQGNWIGALKHYQEFCNDKYGTRYDFASRLKAANRGKQLPNAAGVAEVFALLDAVPLDTLEGRRNRAILEILYCDLRNNELCLSRLRDYRSHEVHVVFGKGGRERFVPINDTAWEMLCRYAIEFHGGLETPDRPDPENVRAFDDYMDMLNSLFDEIKRIHEDEPERRMFYSNTGKPLDPRRVREIVTKAAKDAGISERMYPHRLRHSFATHVLDNGGTDLISLMHVMGHTNLEMLKRYVKVSRAARFNRVNAFHPRQMKVNTMRV